MIVSKDEYDSWHVRDGLRQLKRTKKRYTLDELFGE
jgi:hypothetical protein